MYAAGVLRAKGHDVSYARRCLDYSAFDLILVTTAIISCETEVEIIRHIHADGVSVGAIGSFATSVPEPYVGAGAFVIRGEPEIFLMAETLTLESVSAMAGVVSTDVITDINDLPYPAWDLTFSESPPVFWLLGKERMLPIVATRGCPYSCFHYCTYPLQQGRTVRLRTPATVVAEMAYWQDEYGVTGFIFRDPVFSINRKHTLEFCAEIKKSGRKFRFIIETHLNNIDDELGAELVSAGMIMVKVGVESVNEESLQDAQRFAISHREEEKRLDALRRLGAQTTCMFILGLPKDTRETCLATVEYAKNLDPTFAQFSVFTPYPGTPAFATFKDRICVDQYEDFDQFQLVFEHDALTPAAIRHLLSIAYHRYYFRLSWILRYVRIIMLR